MNDSLLDVLGIAFLIWGFVIVFFTYFSAKNRVTEKVQIITFINAFYSIIYGFSPAAICFYMSKHGNGEFPLNYISIGGDDIKSILWFLLASILAFVGINFGYKIKSNCRIAKSSHISQRGVRLAASFLMIIGWSSLLLWTGVYGGPIGILPYANALRAGRDVGIYNPWSFMMKLCPFLQLSSYIFFSQYLTSKKSIDFIMFILSGAGSFLYILANSSRMHFALFFVILVLLYAGHRTITRKMYVLLAVFGVVGLCVMHVGESILDMFQNGISASAPTISFDLLKILREEFFFPIASFQTYNDGLSSGEIGIRFFTDIANSFFAWLPSRFKPAGLISLEVSNTLLHSGTTLYGGLPTDFVTTCLYELGVVGLCTYPVLFGYLAKVFERKFRYHFSNDFFKVIYILGIFYFIKAVGYGDPANIMGNIFFLVWGYIFISLICKFIRVEK